MPEYSIFTLGESQMTISGGGQLDGVTQGDGSHLVGLTITLNAPAWEEVRLRDDDTDFRDNDGGQRLDGAQSLDGVSYADGTRVEAEYSIELSDGVDTWTAIAVNVVNSSPSYATIEGLAFIGGPGGFPPVGVALQVVSAAEGPNFDAASYATPVCYLRGTPILTPAGPRPIERLQPGDLVETADRGPQPLRWTGARQVLGVGRFAPVEIAAGTLGADRPLRVSQQHRLVIGGPTCELLFGEPEVFVPAIHLAALGAARICPPAAVAYHHLRLDRHEVIFAAGLASESLFLGDLQRAETSNHPSAFFAGTPPDRPAAARLARRCMRRHESAALLAAMGGPDALWQAPAQRRAG